MKRRVILVTGATGRLGAVVAQVLSHHHDVVLFDLYGPADPAQRKSGRVIVGSVTDRAAVASAFEGVDTVIHCAAIPWNRRPYDDLIHTNVVGTVNLLEEAGTREHVEQFIFISTVRVHGVMEEVREEFMPRYLPFDEAHPFLAMEYYGGGKGHAEHWCHMYVRRFGKPAVVFRPTFIVAVDSEPQFAAVPEPGHPALLDYVACSDFVRAIGSALEYHPKDGFDAFLIHALDQRSTTPTLELVDRYFTKIPADREKLAGCDGFAAFVDCAHARDVLGWEPQFRCRR